MMRVLIAILAVTLMVFGCGMDETSNVYNKPHANKTKTTHSKELFLTQEGNQHTLVTRQGIEVPMLFFDGNGHIISPSQVGFPKGAQEAKLLVEGSHLHLKTAQWTSCCNKTTNIAFEEHDGVLGLNDFNLGNHRHRLHLVFQNGDIGEVRGEDF